MKNEAENGNHQIPQRPRYGTPEHKVFIKQMVEQYERLHSGSKIVNADLARRLLPGYDPSDINNENLFFGDAAEIMNAVFRSWIQLPKKTAANVIVWLAGGTGSGKTTIAQNMSLISYDYEMIIDSTFSSYDYSDGQISQAIDAGFKPSIIYVYRDPVDAWENGVWPRWEREKGHFVKADVHIATHCLAKENIVRIAESYGAEIKLTLFNNITGKEPQKMNLDTLSGVQYDIDSIRKQMNEISKAKAEKYPVLQGRNEIYVSDREGGDAGSF